MRIRLILILIATLTVFAQTVSAKSEFAKPLTYWVDKYRKNPGNSLHVFNLGVAYHREGKLKKSIRYYIKTIRLKGPLSPAAFLYMAHAFEELGDNKKALRSLNRVNEDELPVRLKVRVENLRGRLLGQEPEEYAEPYAEDVEEPRKLFTYWDFSGGVNDNPDYEDAASTSSTQYQAKLYLSYEMFANDSWDFKPDFAFDGTMYSDAVDSNANYFTVTSPLSYYTGDTRLKVIPELTIDTLAGVSYSKTSSGTFDINQKLGSYYAGLSYQYLNVSVDDADSAYLNGYGHVGVFELRKQGDDSDISLFVNYADYNYRDSDDVIASYLGPSIALTYSLYLGNWDWTVYLNAASRKYDPDSSNSDFVREDTLATVSFTAGYSFSTLARLYSSVSYSTNNSNDDDNDYNQLVYVFGLSGSY